MPLSERLASLARRVQFLPDTGALINLPIFGYAPMGDESVARTSRVAFDA